MSDLKWDSEKIRKHLRAVSGLYDIQLKKNGLDPNKMRHAFHTLFSRKYAKLRPNKDLKIELKQIEAKYKKYVIYDLCKTTRQHIDGWTNDEQNEYFLFVGEKLNGDFITRNVTRSMTVGMCVPVTDGRWNICDEMKPDFVDITLRFQHLIVDLCEHWTFELILASMLSME